MADVEHDANTEPGDYQVIRKAGAELHLIPEELYQLNVELQEHWPPSSPLGIYLARVRAASKQDANSWITDLAAVAAFCGIGMDGRYDAAGLNWIADMCRTALIKRRME